MFLKPGYKLLPTRGNRLNLVIVFCLVNWHKTASPSSLFQALDISVRNTGSEPTLIPLRKRFNFLISRYINIMITQKEFLPTLERDLTSRHETDRGIMLIFIYEQHPYGRRCLPVALHCFSPTVTLQNRHPQTPPPIRRATDTHMRYRGSKPAAAARKEKKHPHHCRN